MKRSIISIFGIWMLCMGLWTVRGEDYRLFHFTGNVKVGKSYGKWKKAKNRTELSAKDWIKISDNSSVDIIDEKSNKIYHSDIYGESKVDQLISQSINKSKGFTSKIKNQIKSNLSPKPIKRSRVKGASHAVAGLMSDIITDPNKERIEYSQEYIDSIDKAEGYKITDTEEKTIRRDSIKIGTIGELLVRGNFKKPFHQNHFNENNEHINGKVLVNKKDSIVSFVIEIGQENEEVRYFDIIMTAPFKNKNKQTGEYQILPRRERNISMLNEGDFWIAGNNKLLINWMPSVYNPDAVYMLLVCDNNFNLPTQNNQVEYTKQRPENWSVETWFSNAALIPMEVIFIGDEK